MAATMRPVITASGLQIRRFASTIAPPLLSKIRNDLKTAMKEQDHNRLSVLRSLIAETSNASKTSSPIETDVQMLTLLRKTAKASRIASEEFAGAGRADLADKENLQVKIIEDYAAGVETLAEGEIVNAILAVINDLKVQNTNPQIGLVLKKLFGPDSLGEKTVDRANVARLAKQVLSNS